MVSPCILEGGVSPRGVCVDGYTDQVSFKSIEEMQNYVCFSASDLQKIIRALRLSGRTRAMIEWEVATRFEKLDAIRSEK